MHAEHLAEGEPDSAAPIRTDRRSYRLQKVYSPELEPSIIGLPRGERRAVLDREEVTIVATFTNRSGGPIYIPPCRNGFPKFHLEKATPHGWTEAYPSICAGGLPDNLRPVVPGETLVDTLTIYHSRRPKTHPRFLVSEIAGTYRLVYTAYVTWSADRVRRTEPFPGILAPIGERVSNEFLIRE
jgi:hypothetical protein